MQKLPWQEKGQCMCKKRNLLGKGKKEAHSLSAVTRRVTTPKSFSLLVEGTMHLSLDNVLANLFTSSSRHFYQWPMTKNSK